VRVLLIAVLTFSIGLVVILARQLESSRVAQIKLRNATLAPQPGNYVPAYEATDLRGGVVRVGEPRQNGRQVLLVYNPRCPHCLATLPAWDSIARALSADTLLEIIGISLDPDSVTQVYAETHALRFPSIRVLDNRLVSLQRLFVVPQTLVGENGGIVATARIGRLDIGAATDSIIFAARGAASNY
jgi:hypothetical protein